jgi:hypothetical protein
MTIDHFAKLGSMIGGIIVAIAAVIAYYETATREQKKPFREAQLNLCREASDTAATLASIIPRPALSPAAPTDKIEDPWGVARVRFEQLYWGSLAIVEDLDVEEKMVIFLKLLLANEKEIRAGALVANKSGELQQAALRISHACRALVSQSWRLELPLLPGKQSN